MSETKGEIRKRILALRDGMSREERERGTLLLTDRILGHQWFYRCEDFLCFVSYGSEIGTRELILEALRIGKRVYVPKVIKSRESVKLSKNATEEQPSQMVPADAPYMEFYRITSLEDLQEGYRGILEPDGETERFLYRSECAHRTLMLMPGVAFDKYRNRIGYGKGFYDRYLADKEDLQLCTIGVGYSCQLVEEIQAQEGDIKPYQVICV
jgi:5-formyltetrahydrofolate cyclo-ligase